MVRDPFAADPAPDARNVLGALDDSDCQSIVRHLEGPMTANEISETCDIPLSTTYRKLSRLVDASLVEERTQLRPDGHHTSRYELVFEEVTVSLEDDRSLVVEITRPIRSPDDRLADLWAELQKET